MFVSFSHSQTEIIRGRPTTRCTVSKRTCHTLEIHTLGIVHYRLLVVLSNNKRFSNEDKLDSIFNDGVKKYLGNNQHAVSGAHLAISSSNSSNFFFSEEQFISMAISQYAYCDECERLALSHSQTEIIAMFKRTCHTVKIHTFGTHLPPISSSPIKQ